MSRIRRARYRSGAVLAAALIAVGCNPSSPTQPTTPTPTPQPGPITYNIAVTVNAADGSGGIAGAMLEVLDGQFTGSTHTVGDDGRITLTGAQGNMNIEAMAAGFSSRRMGVGPPATNGGTQSLTFSLDRAPTPPPPPSATFTLSGTVRESGSGDAIEGALVEITTGTYAGRSTTTDSDGDYSIADVFGQMVVRAFLAGYILQEQSVTVDEDTDADFSLEEETSSPPPTPSPQVTMCLALGDEELHITNTSGSPLNLQDWFIRDNDDNHEYRFFDQSSCRGPVAPFLLGPGGTVIVTSGLSPVHGPPSRIAGWCNNVWNNNGDRARLFDNTSKLIASVDGSLGSC